MRQLNSLETNFTAAISRHIKLGDVDKGPVGLAVSGGSDSLALLLYASRWGQQTGHKLLVLTIDHGLRPEAAAEAESVAAQCKALGIDHQILRWTEPVKTQAAARRARHALLADALRQAGGRYLLTGHTADDQAETFLIRAGAGSGWYGLAGMSEMSVSPVWPEGRGIRLVRPLLNCRRTELRVALVNAGWDWCDDPTNEDMSYERVRMRRLLESDPGLHDRVRRIQQQLSILRKSGDILLANWLASGVKVNAHGLVSADMDALEDGLHIRGLSLLTQAASGNERPPDGAGLARLANETQSIAPMPGQTLGGAWLRKQSGKLQVARDPGCSGKGGYTGDVWDGRFIVAEGEMAEEESLPHVMVRETLPQKGIIKTCLVEERLSAFAEALGGP